MRSTASSRRLPAILLPALLPALLAALLAACAGTGPVSAPVPTTGAPPYLCPDGSRVTVRFDPDTDQTDLWVGRVEHRLAAVPDPIGGVLYQDSDYQLRRGPTDATALITDRSTTLRQSCVRVR